MREASSFSEQDLAERLDDAETRSQKRKAEVQNDMMHDRGSERRAGRSKQRVKRADPQRVKRTEKSSANRRLKRADPQQERADPQRAKEDGQQQATSTKRAGDDEAGVQDVGVTHASSDVHAPGQEQDRVPHSRNAQGVDSLIFDARGNRLASELSRRDCVTGTAAQTSGDSTDAALEQQL